MTEKICRLCLQTIKDIYQAIDECTLKSLKLTPRIFRETVICTECANYLEVFSNLKPVCVYTRDGTLPLTDPKSDVNLETMSKIKSLIETGIKCSFCAKISGRGGLVSLSDSKRTESLVDLLTQHVPEMNFKNTEELLTCETCLDTLRGLFNFISKCLEVEEKINKYIETNGMDDKSQIELKDIQQFIFRQTVKLEIESFDVNELEEKCDNIQNEYTMTTEAEIKYENEINNAETITNTEDADLKLESIIKTEDINVKSEQSDSESCQEPFEEYKISDDPLETSGMTPKKYIKKHTLKRETCSYETNCEDALEQHLLDMEHKKYLQLHLSTDETPSDVTLFKCAFCSYRSKYKKYVKRHLLIHKTPSDIHMFKCELCSYQAKRKEYLQNHLLTHKTGSEVPMFKCELCPYEAKRKIYLQKHLLTHKTLSEIPMFKCQYCSYWAKRKENLQKHLLIHRPLSDVPMFKCELCSYQAKRKEYLQNHILIHKTPSELPMFKCELCSYQAKRRVYLQNHLLTHKSPSEVTMFKCELCSYQTKRKDYLPKHLLTHNTPAAVQMFKCEYCPYRAKCKKYLRTHLLTHKTPLDVKILKCEMCTYETKRREYLQKHLLTHNSSSEVPMYKCELCSYETKRKQYIPKHLLTHKSLSKVSSVQM